MALFIPAVVLLKFTVQQNALTAAQQRKFVERKTKPLEFHRQLPKCDDRVANVTVTEVRLHSMDRGFNSSLAEFVVCSKIKYLVEPL